MLKRLAARVAQGGIIGINIGANRDSPDRAADYVKLVEAFAPVVSYITVNVSSPNTPGLRNLQEAKSLDDLLARVIEVRDRVRAHAGPTPLLLKIAPDLTLADLDDLVGVARDRTVDGMIVGNTTLSRPPSLREREKSIEQGGLSGKPLFPLSTRMLAETYVRLENAMPVIGVGGIDSGEAAVAKIRAGATLVQLYSGLVFHGLALLDRYQARLARRRSRRADTSSFRDLVGVDAADITAQPMAGPLRGMNGDVATTPLRRVDQPHDEPDRDHDHRAEQEIAPQPVHGVEAEIPDRAGSGAGCSR